MIKKIFISYLLVICLSHSALKAVDEAVVGAGIAALVIAAGKITAEAIAINQLDKTTAKAVGAQGTAEIVSNSINSTVMTCLLGILGFMFSDPNSSSDDGEKVAAVLATLFGVTVIGCSSANTHKSRTLLKLKKKIAQYRNDPQVQEFLTIEKSKQRRWIAANYLVPILTILGVVCAAGTAKDNKKITKNRFIDISVGASILSLLAGYISEQFRTARLLKAASATEDNPLDIPDQEEEEKDDEDTDDEDTQDAKTA